MKKGGVVYIITNKNKTVLYTGVTSNLLKRMDEHKTKKYPNSFSARYNCYILVYYRYFSTIIEAISEEKRIKGGSRKQKLDLIYSMNKNMDDLILNLNEW